MSLVTIPETSHNGQFYVQGGGDITSLSDAPTGTTVDLIFTEDAQDRGVVSSSQGGTGNLLLAGDLIYRTPDVLYLIRVSTWWVERGRSVLSRNLLYDNPMWPSNLGVNPLIDGQATQTDLGTMISQRISSPSITIRVVGPTTTATTIRFNTLAEAGANNLDFTVAAGSDVATQAAALVTAMTANTAAGRDFSTYFKATSSQGSVTLKPRVPWQSLRNISMQVVSGTGVVWKNLDGSTVSTTAVVPSRVAMGGTVRIPHGNYDGRTETAQTPIIIDTPNVTLEAEPGALVRAATGGLFVVEASGFRCKGLNMLWEDHAGDDRNGKSLVTVAASDAKFEDCEITIDGIGAQGSGDLCSGITSDQALGTYSYHGSEGFHTIEVIGCRFYLGNRVIGMYTNSVKCLRVEGCHFSSIYGRTNKFGDGPTISYEAPLYAAWMLNSDYIHWTNNDVLNIGGSSNGDNSSAAVRIERTGNGLDGKAEGGHVTIQGGRFHGTVNHYGSQLLLRNLWFARVADVEFHRHLISTSHTPAHNRQDVSGLLVIDCIETKVSDCEWFNYGSDGSGNVNYDGIRCLALQDAVGMGSGDRSKTIAVTGCTWDNKVASASFATDAHSFFSHYCTTNGHPWDLVTIEGNTMITGNQATARVTILDRDNLAAGEGIEIIIPQDTFAVGTPASDLTISAREGTDWSKANLAGGEHGTAQLLAAYLNGVANFSAHMLAMVSEDSYAVANDPDAGATVLIESKRYGTAGNGITIEHLSSVSGTTSVSVGRKTTSSVAEGATANLAGGYGTAITDGQIAIILTDASNPLPGTGQPPKQARISGNNIRGWQNHLLASPAPATMNTVADDNTIF